MMGPLRRLPAIAASAALLLLTVPRALAHVDYVVGEPGTRVDPVTFLVQVLTEPGNALLLALGILAVVLLLAGVRVTRDLVPDLDVLRSTLEGYSDLVPWMLRLSVGLPLVGAGFAGYLLTPAVPLSLRLPQVVLGFLLLFGLVTRAAALLGLLLYVAGVVFHGAEMLLSLEYVGGFLAILVVGPGRPSADHMLLEVTRTPGTWSHRVDPVHEVALWLHERTRRLLGSVPVLVRVPLGLTFIYLGLVEKLGQPGRALAVVHDLGLAGLLPIDPGMWVVGAALVEVAVGLALVLGVFTRFASAAAFLVLTATLLALPSDPVLPHITLFGLTSVVFTLGPGPWSLDERWWGVDGVDPDPTYRRL